VRRISPTARRRAERGTVAPEALIALLSRRLIAVCAPLVAAACAPGPASPIEVRERLDAAPLPQVDVRMLIQPEHQRDAARYLRAAVATLRTCGEWLGPLPRTAVTLVDPPWRPAAASLAADAVVLERTPWWSVTTTMAPELAAARAVSHRFLREAIDTQRLPSWFVDGLAEYAARRAATPLFEVDNLSPGYAFLEERYFQRFVPRFIRVRLKTESDGGPVPAYRARPAADPMAPAPPAEDRQSLSGKTLLALGTLERWLGRPVFDAVIAEFVRASRSTQPALADFEQVASRVSGQDLSWFFDRTFRSSDVFDYGVERLISEPEPDGSFVTTVVARRHGHAQFTGSSTEPSGGFESGRGVQLVVTFADGQRRIDYWDGRSQQKTLRYRGVSRAVSAAVDPARTLLLDLRQTNNSKTLAPRAGTAATRWAARYMIWLEDLLLSYASLV
jgi:hypothetical protein